MAETNSDMFGASIAFKHGEFKEPQNDKEKAKTATIEYLYATDLVDTPAATDGLFSAFSHEDTASQVTLFLDEHPEVFELADKHPELIEDFLIKYKSYKESKPKNQNTMNFEKSITDLKQWISDNFQSKVPTGLSTQHQIIFDELKTEFEEKISDLETLNLNLQTKADELQEKHTELDLMNTELQTLNAELKTQNTELQTLNDELQTENNKLSAKSSNPAKKTDPAVNPNKTKADPTLVNLSAQMPEDAKLKFKTSTKPE
jgi:Skp family chaperone for outer membrane proteins